MGYGTNFWLLQKNPTTIVSCFSLQNNDHMRNTVHRHEPPVIGQPLEILEDNGEVLVVDKPASMPVHPCGRFRHNTVIFILGKERGICGLHTVHRLDRLTSGVLLFARTLEVSQKLDQLVRSRQVRLTHSSSYVLLTLWNTLPDHITESSTLSKINALLLLISNN